MTRMRNYDFHQLLSPSKFQRFATSLIAKREKTEIRCNTVDPDGGVDFYDLGGTFIFQID